MRKITYFEKLKGHLDIVSKEELIAFRGYSAAQKYNLSMPIVVDTFCIELDKFGKVAEVYTNAHIGKFILANAESTAIDTVASLYRYGYKVLDIVDLKEYLGNASCMTCCRYGLIIGRR